MVEYCLSNLKFLRSQHYLKSVGIRSFLGPYFPTFGLKTEIYSVNLRIQCEFWKIRTLYMQCNKVDNIGDAGSKVVQPEGSKNFVRSEVQEIKMYLFNPVQYDLYEHPNSR